MRTESEPRCRQSSVFVWWGAVFGGVGVAAGAFGAHGLKSIVTLEMLTVFETAVRYQMYHGLALLALGGMLHPESSSTFIRAGWCWVLGVFLFSGSLYVVALSGIRWVGAITPLGGLAFVIGWSLVAWGVRGQPAR